MFLINSFPLFRESLGGLIEGINSGDLFNSNDTMELNLHLSPDSLAETLAMMDPVTHKYPTIYSPEQQFTVIPAHFSQLPSIETFDTDWGFDIELNSESASKTSRLFSTNLNKAFVKINTFLNIYVKYTVIDSNQPLFIRAMVVYQQTNDFTEPVRKCTNHRDRSMHENLPFPEHVLRCSAQDTEYIGTEMGKLFQDKLALRIPLIKVATGEPLKLQFTCQNSCSGGMNRRYTSVIFTLENSVFDVLGRKVLNFKVCSCPKRDKEKDEEFLGKSLPKKRKLDQQPTTSKKIPMPQTIIKQESDSALSMIPDIPSLPSDLQSVNSAGLLELKREPETCDVTITMPNPELARKVLKNAYDVIAGEMMRTGDNGGLERYLLDIQKQIGK